MSPLSSSILIFNSGDGHIEGPGTERSGQWERQAHSAIGDGQGERDGASTGSGLCCDDVSGVGVSANACRLQRDMKACAFSSESLRLDQPSDSPLPQHQGSPSSSAFAVWESPQLSMSASDSKTPSLAREQHFAGDELDARSDASHDSSQAARSCLSTSRYCSSKTGVRG